MAQLATQLWWLLEERFSSQVDSLRIRSWKGIFLFRICFCSRQMRRTDALETGSTCTSPVIASKHRNVLDEIIRSLDSIEGRREGGYRVYRVPAPPRGVPANWRTTCHWRISVGRITAYYTLLYRNCRKLWPLVRSSFEVIVKDECHLPTQCKTATYLPFNFFFQVTCLAYCDYIPCSLVNIIHNSNRSCNFFDISFSRVTTEYSNDKANNRYSVRWKNGDRIETREYII